MIVGMVGLPLFAIMNCVISQQCSCRRFVMMSLLRLPCYIPLSGESISPTTAIHGDDAQGDIHTRGFCGRQLSAFFDIRVFHPNVPSNRSTQIVSLFRRQKLEKKREYGDHIRAVESASFTPLVFSTFGGLSREATIFYSCLADLLSRKHSSYYSHMLSWMRHTLSFSLLRSAILAIRGSQTIRFAECPPSLLSCAWWRAILIFQCFINYCFLKSAFVTDDDL